MTDIRPVKLGLGAAISALALSTSAMAAGGKLTVAVNELPRSLDPVTQTGNVDVRVYYNIFDTLIRRDFGAPGKDGAGFGLAPGLATSWTWLDDTTFEVKLREGVTCHDGNPFNADDVMATFAPERLWGPDSYYPDGRAYFGDLKAVEKVDDLTVRFVTKSPDPTLEQRLTSYTSFVVCNEALEAFRKDGEAPAVWMKAAEDALRWKPVGTGPYKVGAYQKDSYLELDAFKEGWQGTPAVDKITFRSVPEVAARVSGLVAGDYDLIVDIPTDQWQVVQGYSDLELKTIPIENSHLLVFNMSDPVLSDVKLRKAMSLAIDRAALIKALWADKTFTPNGLQLPSFGDLYIADHPGYSFDPEAARALLAESSYKGQEISYRVIPNYYVYNVEAAQIIQEMWRAVGINARIDFVESFKEVRADGAQVYAWSNTYRIPDPTGAIIPLYGPKAAIQEKYKFFVAPDGFNALSDTVASSRDAATRRADFAKMLTLFDDAAPITLLYDPVLAYGMSKKVTWQPYSQFFMDFGPGNLKMAD